MGLYTLHYNNIAKHLCNIEKPKSLEVGCQTATTSCLLAMNGIETTCIDSEQLELEKGMNTFKEYKVNGKFALMNGFDLKFPDNSFDVVFNMGMIEHYSKQQQDRILQEMKRVSKRFVYVSVPNRFHPQNKNEIEYAKRPGALEWEKHYYPMAFWELSELFERNGLWVSELSGSWHAAKGFLKPFGLWFGFEICIMGRKLERLEKQ